MALNFSYKDELMAALLEKNELKEERERDSLVKELKGEGVWHGRMVVTPTQWEGGLELIISHLLNAWMHWMLISCSESKQTVITWAL